MASMLFHSLSALALILAFRPMTRVENVTISVGRSCYTVKAREDVAMPSVLFSIPMPFEGQTPLAIHVRSEPADAVLGFQVEEDRENRPVRVFLKTLKSGATVELRTDTVVLIREGVHDDGRGVPLTPLAGLPEDAREQMRPAPGVEAADEAIVEVARAFSRKDLRALVEDVLAFLRDNIEPGSGVQGAKDVLKRKTAACTGHANLGAALFLASGVPARILPCLLVGMEQQEHYIVEVWSKKSGWERVETTAKRFPVEHAMHLVLRVTHPDSARSFGDVPLLPPKGEGLDCSYGVVGKKASCFQSAEALATVTLDAREAQRFQERARTAFAGLVKSRSAGTLARCVPSDEPRSGFTDREQRFLSAVEAALGP